MMSSEEIAFGKIPIENVALFMCDVQEKFRPAMVHFESVAKNAKKLVDALRVLQVPFIVTEQYPKGLGNTVNEINIEHAVKVVSKTKFSMVVPEVENVMKTICGGQLKCAILFGIEAHVCVEQTAIDLTGKGIKVHIVADASTSRAQEDRLLSFERLKQIGCFITTTENVIFKLIGDKDHPKFPEIRPLIKDTSLETGLLSKMVKYSFEKLRMSEKLELMHAELLKLSQQGSFKSSITSLLRGLKFLMEEDSVKETLTAECAEIGTSPVVERSVSSGGATCKQRTEKICPVCSKFFKRPQDLKRHIAIHEESSNFLCEDCGKSYRSSDGLNYHKALVHASSLPSQNCVNAQCQECDKLFPNDVLLKVHLKNSHRRAKSAYTCSVCIPPTTFERKDVYKNHIALHNGEKKFACHLCSKIFSSRSNLQAHWRTHDSRVSLQCSTCLKKFNSKRKLAEHNNQCLNRKQCKYCKFNCQSLDEMTDHMKRVHPADYAMQQVFGSSLEDLSQHL